MSIHIKPSHRGLLHEKLGVPEGEKIPESKLEQAEHSSSPAERKEAHFAENAKHWSHHSGVEAQAMDAHGASQSWNGK